MTTTTLTNYDGSLVTTPQKVAYPETVEELQSILRQPTDYPSPVRAMGSFHSLTPCASSPGTVVRMSRMKKVLSIDREHMTFTAQAGLELVEAARILRAEQLQFMLNVEIGNLTLGSAACCQTKDGLDGAELGQVNSYVTRVKWVSPSGGLEEASQDTNPELLSLIRSSYGLAGIVYEVTFRIKPLEIVKFDYSLCPLDELTQDRISRVVASNMGMVCWTMARTVVIQTRSSAPALRRAWLAKARRFSWDCLGAASARGGSTATHGRMVAPLAKWIGDRTQVGVYGAMSALGGFSLYNPDKIIDYSRAPQWARYAFTFWGFPRQDFVANLQAYHRFSTDYWERHRFHCNLPLGSYLVRKDSSSLLSYTHDGDVISIDPIHAPGPRHQRAWEDFLRAFNAWAHQRGGIPLLNQSPFVTKEHVSSAYGDRWRQFSGWVRDVDPTGRMLNQFFRDLLDPV